jgi:hypothetical protein
MGSGGGAGSSSSGASVGADEDQAEAEEPLTPFQADSDTGFGRGSQPPLTSKSPLDRDRKVREARAYARRDAIKARHQKADEIRAAKRRLAEADDEVGAYFIAAFVSGARLHAVATCRFRAPFSILCLYFAQGGGPSLFWFSASFTRFFKAFEMLRGSVSFDRPPSAFPRPLLLF